MCVLQQRRGIATAGEGMCVATGTRHVDRPGQLNEFEQDGNTDSERRSNTDSHSARSEAHAAQQCTAEPDEKGLQSKEQCSQQTVPSATKLKQRPGHARAPGGSAALPMRGEVSYRHITNTPCCFLALQGRWADEMHAPEAPGWSAEKGEERCTMLSTDSVNWRHSSREHARPSRSDRGLGQAAEACADANVLLTQNRWPRVICVARPVASSTPPAPLQMPSEAHNKPRAVRAG